MDDLDKSTHYSFYKGVAHETCPERVLSIIPPPPPGAPSLSYSLDNQVSIPPPPPSQYITPSEVYARSITPVDAIWSTSGQMLSRQSLINNNDLGPQLPTPSEQSRKSLESSNLPGLNLTFLSDEDKPTHDSPPDPQVVLEQLLAPSHFSQSFHRAVQPAAVSLTSNADTAHLSASSNQRAPPVLQHLPNESRSRSTNSPTETDILAILTSLADLPQQDIANLIVTELKRIANSK